MCRFRSSHILSVCVAGFLLPPISGQLHGQTEADSLWRDPVFRKQLIGSFGVDAGVEPPITNPKYEEYHEKIAPMIENEPSKATAMALPRELQRYAVLTRKCSLRRPLTLSRESSSGA